MAEKEKILAAAEAAVHRKTLEEIHFHEVGAVDAIVPLLASDAIPVRRSALYALGHIGPAAKKALPRIDDIGDKCRGRHPHRHVRDQIPRKKVETPFHTITTDPV